MSKRRCTAITRAGRPCQAWAVPGTEPPRCAQHKHQVTRASALLASFYGGHFTAAEKADLAALASDTSLGDEIATTRVVLRRLLAVLDENPELSPKELAAIAPLAFRGAKTVARLLRDERAISGAAADGIAGAIGQALDELGTEWGLEL